VAESAAVEGVAAWRWRPAGRYRASEERPSPALLFDSCAGQAVL